MSISQEFKEELEKTELIGEISAIIKNLDREDLEKVLLSLSKYIS